MEKKAKSVVFSASRKQFKTATVAPFLRRTLSTASSLQHQESEANPCPFVPNTGHKPGMPECGCWRESKTGRGFVGRKKG